MTLLIRRLGVDVANQGAGPRAPRFDPDLAPDASVSTLTFAAPFAEKAQFSIEVPRNQKDDSGRALSNADLFPLKVATASMPPLAKFAAAPFGVVERFGELPRRARRAGQGRRSCAWTTTRP